MPKISIIIPIFNKSTLLKKTIESVLHQTYSDFELILINDGSTDDSESIMREYQRKDERILCFTQENNGVSYTRNKGIKLATGEYISFLDADDVWNEYFLEKMLFSVKDKNVVYCGHMIVSQQKRKKAKINFVSGDILSNYIYNKCTPNTNSWLIKRSYIINKKIIFPKNMSWGEDMIFFAQVLLHDKNVIGYKGYLTEYHIDHPHSLSENSLSKIDDHINWMNYLEKILYEYEKDSVRKKQVEDAIITYRLPAGIIYRLLDNLNISEFGILYEYYKNTAKYRKNVRLCNGMRSVKLLFFKIKLEIWFIYQIVLKRLTII